MKKYFAKILILFCFALLNININAAIITKIVNKSGQNVTFALFQNKQPIDDLHFIISPNIKIILSRRLIFPENTEPFCSLIEHEVKVPKKGYSPYAFKEMNVANYLKINTKLGIFYLTYGNLIVDLRGEEAGTRSSFWKQQVAKTATKTMGDDYQNLVVVIDETGEIQLFEDRSDFG